MKQKTVKKQVDPNNALIWILVSFCGGYILPSTCCWQMLPSKKKKASSALGEVVSIHS